MIYSWAAGPPQSMRLPLPPSLLSQATWWPQASEAIQGEMKTLKSVAKWAIGYERRQQFRRVAVGVLVKVNGEIVTQTDFHRIQINALRELPNPPDPRAAVRCRALQASRPGHFAGHCHGG